MLSKDPEVYLVLKSKTRFELYLWNQISLPCGWPPSKSEKHEPAAMPSKQEQYEELQALKQVVLDEKMKDMSRQIIELKEQ